MAWTNPIVFHPRREVYYAHYFRIAKLYGWRPEGRRAYIRLRRVFGLSEIAQ